MSKTIKGNETNLQNKNLNEKPKDNFIEYSIYVFSGVNVLLLSLSIFFSFYLTAFLAIFTIVCYLVYVSDWGKNTIEKLKVYRELRPYLKASRSLNHSTTLLGKFLCGLPVKNGETEVDSFNDIKEHYGEKWPFMVKVRDTRNRKITVSGKPMTCISSYNYLDLGRDERVNQAAIDAANAYSTGNHGPRMLCGNLEILEQLEKKIASFFKRDAALAFSSGYLACMSAIAGIARKGDLLLMDRLCHASLVAGSKLSQAKTVKFKHNDFADAERQIKKHKFNRVIMVIEGIYSMDGDVGDLPAARKLCDKYKGILVMDEAHSLGTLGKTGHGNEEIYDYKYKADVLCGTFSKSVSGVGGFLTCNQKLREFYTFYSPGLVFSAPLSAYHAGGALKAFEIIEQEPERVSKLQQNGEYLRKELVKNGFDIERSCTPVVPVIFKDLNQLINMHQHLQNQGIFAAAVMAPACPLDASRFRLCATSADTKESLDNIVQALKKAREANPENEKITKLVKLLK